jgi:hypothetical protein
MEPLLEPGVALSVGVRLAGREGFGCAGRFAWAAVDFQRFTLSAAFRAEGTWRVTILRTRPCNRQAVPKKIYFNACIAS